jgi:hypothetical protein
VQPALEDLAVPAPIGADEADTGPATLAMAAAALDGAEAAALVDRIDPTRSAAELAHRALSLGYHAYLYTPDADEVPTEARQAGLQVRPAAQPADVARALASRHAVVVSAPDDGPPFLLVLREAGGEIVVDDPSVEERTLTWTWGRLAQLLDAEPPPRVLVLAARTREDH